MNNLSVIIPSHGRVLHLVRLLESLQRARDNTGMKIEILVVDSSSLTEKATLRRACRCLRVCLLDGPVCVRTKRNIGARCASHEWLLFLDSDCEASVRLIDAYRRAVETYDNPEAAAGPTCFQGGETFFTRSVIGSALLDPFRRPLVEGELLWATTSNFLVQKCVWERLGGFREDLPFRLGGDDTDFCLRIKQVGGRIRSVPEAVCYHTWVTWRRPWYMVKRSFRWGWMHGILLKTHPHFRRLDIPSFAVHAVLLLLISLLAAWGGKPLLLLLVPIFTIISLLLHALLVTFVAKNKIRAFYGDLLVALVELPFGFGRLFGSLASGSFLGWFFRLDESDSVMNDAFPETVRTLWSDHLALLTALIAAWWMV
jgi:glycosyltransferase involved in cell wall biosynthesis